MFLETKKMQKDKCFLIRGMKIDYKSPDGKTNYCRIEILAENEQGIVNFLNMANTIKARKAK